MSPLNPKLFAALTKKFGPPRISNAGESAQITRAIKWLNSKPRWQNEFHGGEYYRVDCPYCGDQRGRLHFSYLWATPNDNAPGLQMHLVRCFNEHCINTQERQYELFDLIFPRGVGPPETPVTAADPLADIASGPKHFALPTGTTSLSELPADHPALQYLAGRGYDPLELERCWGVGYCELDRDSRPQIHDRLVIPVVHSEAGAENEAQERLVGWQARALTHYGGDSPKYLTAAGMAKSAVLYGLPRAGTDAQVVVVVEGVTDVWRFGGNAVATLGKSMSHRQRQLMLSRFSGRPIVIAYDADAASEAERVRNQLLVDRRAQADDAPVVVLNLPAERGDIGDCTRLQAWSAVVDALDRAVGDLTKLAAMLPSFARIHVVDGAAQTLSPVALDRIGGSLALAYDETAAGEPAFSCVGEDGTLRRVVRPSRSWANKLRGQLRIYDDALEARQAELGRSLPAAERYEDLWIMRRLLGDVANRPEEESSLVRAEEARRQWDAGGLRRQIQDEGLEFVYEHVEKPLIAPAAEMMSTGVPVDGRRLEQIVAELRGNSDPAHSGPKGTAQKTRDSLLQSALRLRKSIDSKTGRVHSRLDPLGAATGRFTDSSPNLLSLDARLKSVVVAGKGRQLVQADYSQFELRVAAQLSQDEAWLKAIARGDDLHRLTAAELLNVPMADVAEVDRALGKRVNLSVIYGVQPAGLATKLGTSRDAAEAFLQAFAANHPGFAAWSAGARLLAQHQRFVHTLWGRRRRFSESDAGHLAVNSIVQGTAADLFKMALVRLHGSLPRTARMLLPLHDAVLLEVDEADVSKVIRIARNAMTTLPQPFTVPLEVKIDVGRNWGAMHHVVARKRTRPELSM